MAKINVVHVIGGGVLAGLVVNITGGIAWETILADDYIKQLGKELPTRAIPASMWWGLLMGIMAAWLYASIRSHYGPGPQSAVIAGVMTWILGLALPNFALWSFRIFGGSLLALASAIGLVEFILATLAGAWVYEWGEAVAARRGLTGGRGLMASQIPTPPEPDLR